MPASARIVFTSEQLVRLRRPAEFERLKRLLAPFGRQVKVVAYVRRQDEHFASVYSQKIKGGNSFTFDPGQAQRDKFVYDYDDLLAPWAAAFGNDAVIVRPFERSAMSGGDIIADFAEVIGLELSAKLVRPRPMNQSLDLTTLDYLRRLNPHVPRWLDDEKNPNRAHIISILEKLSGPTRLELSTLEADEVMAAFVESNAAVARRYLGREDGQLFREQRGQRPGTRPEITLDEAMAITGQVLTILLAEQPAVAATEASAASAATTDASNS